MGKTNRIMHRRVNSRGAKAALVLGFIACVLTAGPALAGTQVITDAHEGWGSSTTFDFTQTQTVGGVDYFGWDPLTINGYYSGGMYNFDISMPRGLTGGDNFDLVIDADNNDIGDFLIHYSNNGSAAGGGWLGVWGWKVGTNSGGYSSPQNVPASGVSYSITGYDGSNARDFSISFDQNELALGNSIQYAWLSPLGDEGFPQSWPGEAAIINNWTDGTSEGWTSVVVPVPPAAALGLVGMAGVGVIRRFRKKTAA